MSIPSCDDDASALSGPGCDGEIVCEPARAAQPESEPVAAGIAIFQGKVDVRDAGPLILERQPQSPLAIVGARFERQCAAAAIDQRVAGELARRRHQLRLVNQAEAEADGPVP